MAVVSDEASTVYLLGQWEIPLSGIQTCSDLLRQETREATMTVF